MSQTETDTSQTETDTSQTGHNPRQTRHKPIQTRHKPRQGTLQTEEPKKSKATSTIFPQLGDHEETTMQQTATFAEVHARLYMTCRFSIKSLCNAITVRQH